MPVGSIASTGSRGTTYGVTMTRHIQKLIELGGRPILDDLVEPARVRACTALEGAEVILPLLSEKNGFYAFESSLHVFSDRGDRCESGLDEWNSPTAWRDSYGEMAANSFFFAEDGFGNQFCVRNGWICSFDAETADLKPMARDAEEWAELMLEDFEFLSGYPLVHEWQQENGPLPGGKRLVPRTPFVLGGEFHIENLRAADAIEGMRSRGSLAVRIRDLPDGATVTLNAEQSARHPRH